jgi:4-hydroxybenzoate polyprenyltransferase
VALLSGIGALVLAASLHWFALPACLAGYVGVLLYAGGGSRHAPHRPRIKDRLLVKNVYVAAGITGLCALLVAAGSHVRWRELGLGAAVLLLIVLGDSVLCDIPDAESDARFGTHTVPNVFGAAAAWVIALVCHLGSVAIVVTRLGIADTSWSGLVLPAAIAATTAMLMAIRPTHLRDIVDARLGAFGVIALVAG